MRMVAAGEFPLAVAPTGHAARRPAGRRRRHPPRRRRAWSSYASPNALSAVHRLGHVGDVIGEVLAQVVTDLVSRRRRERRRGAGARGRPGGPPGAPRSRRRARRSSMRAIPLTAGGAAHRGAWCCCATSTELRRRERELLTKDATIREIHHRVKNNLQTVAALLRLQARRVDRRRGAGRARGGGAAGRHDRAGARDAQPGLRRDGRLRRDRRPGCGPWSPRWPRASTACEPTFTGQLRPAARRGRHRAGDDPHRAGAERRRARPARTATARSRWPSRGRPSTAARSS